MSDKMIQMPAVTDLEFATILAALRHYAAAEAPMSEHFDDIEEAENGVEAIFVDELAERLNTESEEVEEAEGDKYTVLMMYPEYLTDNYGEETYLAHVVADSVENAMTAAQDQAYQAQLKKEQFSDFEPETDNPEQDFQVVLCVRGHLEDLSWQAQTSDAAGAPGP